MPYYKRASIYYKRLVTLATSNKFGLDDRIKSYDDTVVEKLSYRYTVFALLVCAYLVTTKQSDGAKKNVKCFAPAHFNQRYAEFINEYCFLSSIYYVPFDQKLPSIKQQDQQLSGDHHHPQQQPQSTVTKIQYYQSMQFILAIVAGLLYLPRVCYRMLTLSCDIDLKVLMEEANHIKCVNKMDIEKDLVKYVVHHLDRYLNSNVNNGKLSKKLPKIMRQNHLIKAYMLIKIFNTLNSIFVIKLFSLLLGQDFFLFYGINFLKSFFVPSSIANSTSSYKPSSTSGEPKPEIDTESYFPKVILCDFRIREIGHNPKLQHEFTIQCILPLNLYMQQVFTILWFWLVVLIVANLVDLLTWVYYLLPSVQLKFFKSYHVDVQLVKSIKKHATCSFPNGTIVGLVPTQHAINDENMSEEMEIQMRRYLLNDFFCDYVSVDGWFILRLMSSNLGKYITTAIINELISKYIEKKVMVSSTSANTNTRTSVQV